MADQNEKFQTGTLLHEVIVGAFRTNGLKFEAWCNENNVNPSTARHATYGQSGGDKGKKLLTRIIDAAGRDVVTLAYTRRVQAEADRLQGAA